MLAGVARGLADHLGVDVLYVRLAFVLLAAAGGAGVATYGLFWVFAPQNPYERESPRDRERDLTALLALGSLTVGGLLLLSALGIGLSPGLAVPLVAVGVGVSILWRQADDDSRARWRAATGTHRLSGAARAGVGVALLVIGGGAILVGPADLDGTSGGLVAALVVAAGIALVSSPWWVRMARDLTAERSARIREQERAEVAAHVHDSVLHTLTLIQRHVDDPREVTRLARAQERELRGWLYRPTADAAQHLAAALERGRRRGRGRARRRDRGRRRGRLPGRRAAGGAARRRPGGAGERSEVRRGRAGVALRRGRAGAGHRVRARPRAGLRPGRRAGRPARSAAVGPRPDGPQRGLGRRTFLSGGRHRDPARDAPPDQERTVTDQPSEPSPRTAVRVVLVDDHRMFRSGVRAELAAVDDAVEVVGEAEDAQQAVAVITATLPDVVLLDVHLPGGGGRAVLQELVTELPDVKFLALSVSDAPEDVIAVVRGGARGYVTKSITGPELAAAVRRVADGDAVFSPRLAGFVLDAFAATTDVAEVDEDLDRLSQREREVLRLIARGYTYKEVGKALFISVKTVETHVSAVLRKLQLSNRHELTRWATARRLV